MPKPAARAALALAALLVLAASAHSAPVVAGFERVGRDAADLPARIDGGLLLVGELGCTNCHEAGAAAPHLLPKAGPVLDGVGERIDPRWVERYLADPAAVHPATTMPDALAGLGAEERARTATALAHFLAGDVSFRAVPQPDAAEARPREGAAVYGRVGCRVCHGDRGGDAEILPGQRPLGDLAAKWSPAALDDFLADPHRVRPSGRMPGFALDDQARRDLVAALVIPESSWGGAAPATAAFAGRAWFVQASALPDPATLGTPDRTATVSGFDVEGLAGRADGFVARLEGYLHAPLAGTWGFELASDDGSRLTVDGRRVIDNDGVHPTTRRAGTIELAAGVHPIVIEYFEAAGEQVLDLSVVPPGRARVSAPDLVTPSPASCPIRRSSPKGGRRSPPGAAPPVIASKGSRTRRV